MMLYSKSILDQGCEALREVVISSKQNSQAPGPLSDAARRWPDVEILGWVQGVGLLPVLGFKGLGITSPGG